MKTLSWSALGSMAAMAVLLGACNDVGSCPSDSAAVTPGGSCSGDSLECPYTLETPSTACDGTTVEGGIASSCVCTGGKWACPDPVSCPAPAAPGDDSGAGDDSSGGDAAGE